MYDLMKRNGLSIARPRTSSDWFENMFKPLNYAWSPFNKNKNGDYESEFDVPGFGEGDVEITVDDGMIILRGQKESRRINYSVTIPDGADCSKGEATIKNGVLKIILPMAESAKPKQITVKGAD